MHLMKNFIKEEEYPNPKFYGIMREVEWVESRGGIDKYHRFTEYYYPWWKRQFKYLGSILFLIISSSVLLVLLLMYCQWWATARMAPSCGECEKISGCDPKKFLSCFHGVDRYCDLAYVWRGGWRVHSLIE